MGNLSKELGFLDISLATAGYIIGAGIYAIIGIASKYGKNIPGFLLLFLVLLLFVPA